MGKHLFFILVALLFLASCERFLPYGYTGADETLYVAARLSNTDTAHVFYLSLSKGPMLSEPASGARVECRVDDMLIASTDSVWSCGEGLGIQAHRVRAFVEPGGRYRLDFYAGEHHAWTEITAEQLYSEKVRVDTLSIPSYAEHGANYYDRFVLVFEDIPGKRSYYQAGKSLLGRIEYWKEGAAEPAFTKDSLALGRIIDENELFEDKPQPASPSVLAAVGADYSRAQLLRLFSDFEFQDSEFSLPFACRESPLVTTTWEFFDRHRGEYDYYSITARYRLISLPEKEFRYMYLISYGNGGGDNLLGEPAILPVNIIGGTGFVSVVTETEIEIPLGKRIPVYY